MMRAIRRVLLFLNERIIVIDFFRTMESDQWSALGRDQLENLSDAEGKLAAEVPKSGDAATGGGQSGDRDDGDEPMIRRTNQTLYFLSNKPLNHIMMSPFSLRFRIFPRTINTNATFVPTKFLSTRCESRLCFTPSLSSLGTLVRIL
jgi:hypothetical protein